RSPVCRSAPTPAVRRPRPPAARSGARAASPFQRSSTVPDREVLPFSGRRNPIDPLGENRGEVPATGFSHDMFKVRTADGPSGKPLRIFLDALPKVPLAQLGSQLIQEQRALAVLNGPAHTQRRIGTIPGQRLVVAKLRGAFDSQ